MDDDLLEEQPSGIREDRVHDKPSATHEELLEEARRIVRSSKVDRLNAMPVFLSKAGFRERWPRRMDIAKWEELTPTQQEIAKIIASVNGASYAAGYGLPRWPRELARFAGVLPRGPLERPLPGESDELWRAMRRWLDEHVPRDEVMRRALSPLDPADRAAALLDIVSGAYLIDHKLQVRGDELFATVVQAGDAIVPWLRELLNRYAEHGAYDLVTWGYEPDHIEIVVAALETMGVEIEPHWRRALE